MASECDTQRAFLSNRPSSSKSHVSLALTAQNGLNEASHCLQDIQNRTTAIRSEHDRRSNELDLLLSRMHHLDSVRNKLDTVRKCRKIADTYASVLRPLNIRARGENSDMRTIASSVELLIENVEVIRSDGGVPLLDKGSEVNSKVVKSVEKRCIDAVVKARAAFVNILDNDFRTFGWPMKVPVPGKHDSIINSVKVYVEQLNHLQRVSSESSYIANQTKWHRALSDNWAVAAILRAPLARFKYHFLESFRVQHEDSENVMNSDGLKEGTSRFDRPEWAAEFALERILETTPFLSEIKIDGPFSAGVKFAEGFCQVFAEKVAYDCELALRTSTNDSDADELIAHASETARQFDSKLRGGIISLSPQHGEKDAILFKSSLHLLSLNESFLTTWASSELRLADGRINNLLRQALGPRANTVTDSSAEQMHNMEVTPCSNEELEQLCANIVVHIGEASQKCRWLESGERISTFLKLTELPLLQALRGRLKEDIEVIEMDHLSSEQLGRCGRAALCAQLISDALEDRSVDPFYVAQEERLGRGIYDDEIMRLRALYSSTSSLMGDTIVGSFTDNVRSEYGYSTRFGEVWAADAAMVLSHDLSESLVEPLTLLERHLSAVIRGVPCRRSASLIWRPIASKLDDFFFSEVMLQCFIGGTRNAMPAASEQNGYLTADLCARMARQVAYDTETFVSAFSVATPNPSQFLPLSTEASRVLRIACDKLLLPIESLPIDEDEILSVITQKMSKNEEAMTDPLEQKEVKQLLQSKMEIMHISARDVLELMIVAGHHDAILLS